MTARMPWGIASRVSIDPGLVEDDEGLVKAHHEERHKMTNMGAANRKSGMLETVQYRRKPTSLKIINMCKTKKKKKTIMSNTYQ